MPNKKIRCPSCSKNRNSLRLLPCKHQLCMGCITTQCLWCTQPIPIPQSGSRGSNLPLVFAGSQEPVEELQPQKTKPVQPKPNKSVSVEPAARTRLSQAAAETSTPLLSKTFHIPTKGAEVSSVVFGSNRFLALLTNSSIQVWSIEDLEKDGNPISVGSVTRDTSSQTFVDAAISERGDRFFVVSKTKDEWDVLIFKLSNCRLLKTMRIEQGPNIRSACIGVTDTAGTVAYLVLNGVRQTISVFGQFYRLASVPPHHKNDFQLAKLQMNPTAFRRVAAKCAAKLRHVVAAMKADRPCVLIFLWNGKTLQNTHQALQLVSPSPLLNVCFRSDADILLISSQDRFQWWKFCEGVGKKLFDFEIKASSASNLGILNGKIVAAIDQQTDRGRFRFIFFHLEVPSSD